MTEKTFRNMALSLPEAIESAHMDHPDFRVRGKIFATLGYPEKGWGMVKLTPEQQERFVRNEPDVFVPAAGAWGRGGSTTVYLAKAADDTVSSAIVAAWRNVAPKHLTAGHEPEQRRTTAEN
ncbi:MAG: MmcQ/YjbR family DNA-binding protein [Isosphaeraceae bacterium]